MIRNGLSDWTSPLDPNELAGLALEEHIESRLISLSSDSSGADNWQLENGPFDEQRLSGLSDHNWTLLVQAVDQFVPAVAELRDYFSFIPAWQIDDVMVSFASRGGGVGPHFDRYDVFLVQGQGQRQWKIGQRCDKDTELQGNQALNLLQRFEESDCFTLSAGDILYLPPYLAHWGTSLDNDCMTYSVGFRSPSQDELLDDFITTLQSGLSEDDRFKDAIAYTARQSENSGAIDTTTIDQLANLLHQKITAQLADKQQLSQWFGRWASEPKYAMDEALIASEDQFTEDDIDNILSAIRGDTNTNSSIDNIIYRDDASRFYYIEQHNKPLLLFINGRQVDLAGTDSRLTESVKTLCNHRSFAASTLMPWLQSHDLTTSLIELFKRQELFIE